MRPLTTLSLAAALALGAPVAADVGADLTAPLGPQLSAALDGAFTADAAFIRRSKLKKRPTPTYKPIVITQWDESDPDDDAVDTIEVSFPSLGVGGSGGTLETQTTGFRLKNRKHFKGIITQYPATYSFSVTTDNGDGTSTVTEVPVEGLEPTVVGSETTVITDIGVKATLRVVDADGTLKVVVFNEDGAWDTTTVTDVAVAGVEIPYVRTTQRWVTTIDGSQTASADFVDGSPYTMTIVAKNAAGEIVDVSTSSSFVGDVRTGPSIEKVRVKATNGGDLKVVTNQDGFDGASGSMQVVVTDDAGTTLLSSLDDMSAQVTRLYGMETLTFDDPSSAVDQPYGLVLSAYNSENVSLGASDYEIVVEGLDVSGEGFDGMDISIVIDGESVAGRIAIGQLDPTNFVLAVALATDKVDRLDIELTDLIGNPSAPEAVTFDAPVDESRKWATKGTGGLGTLATGGSATVEVLLLDDTDQVIGSSSSTITEVPTTAYKRGGPSQNGGPLYSSGPWFKQSSAWLATPN